MPRKIIRSILVKAAFLVCLSVQAQSYTENAETLGFSEWPEYENGANVSALPQVSRTLRLFDEHDKVSIEIRYPGGDQGRSLAESLFKWFITLGIPAQYMELVPGSGSADSLVISLIDRR